MTDDNAEQIRNRHDPLKQLQKRFLVGMFAVAALALLNQMVLHPWLIKLTTDAPTINVAGRQRMLSQKISKTALTLFDKTLQPALLNLEHDMTEWTTAHRGLQFGNVTLRLSPNDSPQIEEAFRQLESPYRQIQAATRQILLDPRNDVVRHQAIQEILAAEPDYLIQMHAIVGLFEAESKQHVAQLRRASWWVLGLMLILLASLARFAIRPVMRLIEQRVAERTALLLRTNRQLEQEIHERQNAEQRTRELLDQLAHASRLNSLGQMATGLAHELNQPLGAINNYASAAQCFLNCEVPQTREAETVLKKISTASLRAGAIVHRLRNFMRKDKSLQQTVSVPELIAEVIELCRPEARKQNIAIQFDCEADDLPDIPADAIQISQVLVNLLQNAIHAMEQTSPAERVIRIKLTRDSADELRFDVADRGTGFSAEQAEDLFAPFYTTRTEGLGMGLAICRSIVQEHQGRFWAVSPPTGGAVFSFTLPLVSQHEPADCLSC